MSKEMRLELSKLAEGALQERFEASLLKVVENILDPNTEATKKRTITLTIDFTPDDQREVIGILTTSKEKLVPQAEVATRMLVGRSINTGFVGASEMVSPFKGQTRMNFDEGTLESDIGETISELSDSPKKEDEVIDFRKKSR